MNKKELELINQVPTSIKELYHIYSVTTSGSGIIVEILNKEVKNQHEVVD